MDTVRACIGRIDEDSTGKFPLNIEIPLLQVSVFLFGISCRRIRSLVNGILGHVWLGTASGDWNQSIGQLSEWTLVGAGENVSTRKCTSVGVECGRRSQPLVIAREEIIGRTAYRIDVRVSPE